jgi:hypothetical protein
MWLKRRRDRMGYLREDGKHQLNLLRNLVHELLHRLDICTDIIESGIHTSDRLLHCHHSFSDRLHPAFGVVQLLSKLNMASRHPGDTLIKRRRRGIAVDTDVRVWGSNSRQGR